MADERTSSNAANQPAGGSDKPKKKKKIIIVTGQGNKSGKGTPSRSYSSGGRSGSSAGGRGGRGGSGSSSRQGARGGRGGRSGAAPVHRLVKPTIKPTQMEVDFHKSPSEQELRAQREAREAEEAAKRAAEEAARRAAEEAAAKKAAEEAAAKRAAEEAAARKAAEEAAKRAPAAPAEERRSDRSGERRGSDRSRQGGRDGGRSQGGYSRDGGRGQGGYSRDGGRGQGGSRGQGGYSRDGGRGQGGYRGQSGQGGRSQGGYGGRSGSGDRRSSRPGQGFGGQGGQRGGRGAAPAPSFGGPENNRHADKHRSVSRDHNRKNGRDKIYNEDDRSARAGRFIRPEKKVEEKKEEQIKMITLPEKITIRDLAERMHMRDADIIKKLFLEGQVTTPNSELDYEEAEKIAMDYDILCEKEEKVDVIEELLREDEDNPEDMVSRPPVICVMGHVDHGKTSLLDAIRKTNVTDKEAGGITQAIGAYTVRISGRSITFLDTPGHEAFTQMRMRGANSTDIAVLVVAADDGVMPQTIEAINHAKAAGVEIIVAVNKIDKPNADINRVKQEMTEYGLVASDWGGSTEFVPVSAKTGEGLSDLLETILLTADVLELKANPNRLARAIVLEAKLDKGRGPVANVLIQKGTLHVGDFISAGASSGKVRAMVDDKGRRVRTAGPSQPVELLGLNEVPGAGEILVAHSSDKEAKQFAQTYQDQHKEELVEDNRMRMNLDDLFSQMKEGRLKEFNLIIKADVQGSVEALKQSLLKLSNEEVVVKIIHSGVGAITESDISLASASNAVVIGFNVRPDAMGKSMADHEGVDIRLYKVIYQAIDAVEAALKGMLAPIYEERVIGHAEVRQIFRASTVGNIAGSYVKDGLMRRGCKIRIHRGDEVIYTGTLASLKRYKDDAKEVKEGFECGLVFDGFDKMNLGDIVEAYDLVEVPRE